jgi:hypothetical protein
MKGYLRLRQASAAGTIEATYQVTSANFSSGDSYDYYTVGVTYVTASGGTSFANNTPIVYEFYRTGNAGPNQWGGFPKFVSGYYYTTNLGGMGGNVPTANEMRLVPFYVSETTTFTRISARISTPITGGTFRLGIYSSNSNNIPATRLLDAGTIDGSSTGSKAITISQSLTPGLYWLAGVGQGTSGVGVRSYLSSTFGNYVPNGTTSGGVEANPSTGWSVSSVSGALPSTISSPTLTTLAPVIHLGV